MNYCGLRRAPHGGNRHDSVMSGDTTSAEFDDSVRQCEVAFLLRRVRDLTVIGASRRAASVARCSNAQGDLPLAVWTGPGTGLDWSDFERLMPERHRHALRFSENHR
jgi:hypothetical protein